MNSHKYKDYIGSVEFSEEDGTFFGKIEGIDGLVNFEGESVTELTNAFHEAVDDYTVYCEAEGIEPRKSYSGALNVRLTPDIHSRIAILAKQAGISINAFIRSAVEKTDCHNVIIRLHTKIKKICNRRMFCHLNHNRRSACSHHNH